METVLEYPLQRFLPDVGFVEFHRFGVGFKKPDAPGFVDAEIHGHLPEQRACRALDLSGQRQGRFARLAQHLPSPAAAEGGDQQLLRLFDVSAPRHVGGNGVVSRHPCADAGHLPASFPVFLHQRTQVEAFLAGGGQRDALLGDVRLALEPGLTANPPPQRFERFVPERFAALILLDLQPVAPVPLRKHPHRHDADARLAPHRLQKQEGVFAQHAGQHGRPGEPPGFRHPFPGDAAGAEPLVQRPFVEKAAVEQEQFRPSGQRVQLPFHARLPFVFPLRNPIVDDVGVREAAADPHLFAGKIGVARQGGGFQLEIFHGDHIGDESQPFAGADQIGEVLPVAPETALLVVDGEDGQHRFARRACHRRRRVVHASSLLRNLLK